jgi:hypothetical protein
MKSTQDDAKVAREVGVKATSENLLDHVQPPTEMSVRRCG